MAAANTAAVTGVTGSKKNTAITIARPTYSPVSRYFFVWRPPRMPAGVGAEDVEEPDQCEGEHSHLGGLTLVRKVRRQVRGDEHDLESAYEETEGEQPEAAVARCVSDCLGHGLLARAGNGARAPLHQRGRKRHHHRPERGHEQERRHPTETAISVCPTGNIMNCPKEPAAPVMPSAALRFSGFTARPITPYTTLKVVPESPRPMSSRALPASANPLLEAAIMTSPST